MFNITSKYFSFYSNKLPASLVAHITRDFLACYSCSYYSSMVFTVLTISEAIVSLLNLVPRLKLVNPTVIFCLI